MKAEEEKEEKKREDCRPSLPCEAALPRAISVALFPSLHFSFKQKAGSLKGRIFNQMRWPPGAPCHQAQHDTETERGELRVNELQQQQCEETSTVCF